ncbi:MAG: acetylglutamate kinase [Planctomycetota bacterium]
MVNEATRKARVLIEALPFFKRFHHRYAVVKLGGEAIENDEVLEALLTDLVFLEQVGLRPVLVHGGGPAISRAMADENIEVHWHEGRRVTDVAAMAIVQREAERLNLKLVNRLFDLGGAGIGLVPSRQVVVTGQVENPDLGLVGTPQRVDRARVLRYASRGMIPVIPPLSVDEQGRVLNTNADDVALAVATELGAAKLMFLSNVAGVCTDPGDPSTRISSLTPPEVRSLVEAGVIRGGMIPKVESCLAALEHGVAKIHIVEAGMPHALLLEIFTREGIGTQLTLDRTRDELAEVTE